MVVLEKIDLTDHRDMISQEAVAEPESALLEAQGVEAKYIFILPPRELTGPPEGEVEGEGAPGAAAVTAGERLLAPAPGAAMPRLLDAR
jgi:hypothetical protein